MPDLPNLPASAKIDCADSKSIAMRSRWFMIRTWQTTQFENFVSNSRMRHQCRFRPRCHECIQWIFGIAKSVTCSGKRRTTEVNVFDWIWRSQARGHNVCSKHQNIPQFYAEGENCIQITSPKTSHSEIIIKDCAGFVSCPLFIWYIAIWFGLQSAFL